MSIPLKAWIFVVCCVGSGVCDELITRSEESYRVYVCVCLIVGDLETSKRGGLAPILAVQPQKLCHCRPRRAGNIKFHIIGNNIAED